MADVFPLLELPDSVVYSILGQMTYWELSASKTACNRLRTLADDLQGGTATIVVEPPAEYVSWPDYTFWLLGDCKVGKTSLRCQLLHRRTQDSPLVELSKAELNGCYVSTSHAPARRTYIWDAVSKPGVRDMVLSMIADRVKPSDKSMHSPMHGFLLVFDVTRPKTLEVAVSYLRSIREFWPKRFKLPCVLVANKIDLSADRKVSTEHGISVANAEGVGYMECTTSHYASVYSTIAKLSVTMPKRHPEDGLHLHHSDSSSSFSTPRSSLDESDYKVYKVHRAMKPDHRRSLKRSQGLGLVNQVAAAVERWVERLVA